MIKKFFNDVLPNDDSYKLLWTPSNKISYWFQDINKFLECLDQKKNQDIYFGLGVTNKKKNRKQRFTASEVSTLRVLHLDIDIAKELAHKKTNLPQDLKKAIAIAYAIIEPTYIIHSGYGIHAYYLFFDHIKIDDTDKWTELSYQFQQAHFKLFPEYKLDSTFDLARVLRCPGSFNYKNPEDVQQCKILEHNKDAYYTIEEIEDEIDFDPKGIQQSIPEAISNKIIKNKTLNHWTTLQYCQWFNDEGLEIESDNIFDRNAYINWVGMDDRFIEEYNHYTDRKSASDWDMALANIGIRCGFKLQEIIDMLIGHRNQHNEKLKLDRKDYYARTLLKAMASDQMKKEKAIKYAKTEQEKKINKKVLKKLETKTKKEKVLEKKASKASNKKKLSENDKENIRQYLIDKIGVGVNKIIRYHKTPNEQFDLELIDLPGKVVKLGSFIEGIKNQHTFAGKIGATGVRMPKIIPMPNWCNDVIPKLQALTENGLSPETSTYDGQINVWLREYFTAKDICKDYQLYKENNSPNVPFIDSNKAHFTYVGFEDWVRINRNHILDFGFMTTMISSGFKETQRKTGDNINIKLWASPENFYKK